MRWLRLTKFARASKSKFQSQRNGSNVDEKNAKIVASRAASQTAAHQLGPSQQHGSIIRESQDSDLSADISTDEGVQLEYTAFNNILLPFLFLCIMSS